MFITLHIKRSCGAGGEIQTHEGFPPHYKCGAVGRLATPARPSVFTNDYLVWLSLGYQSISSVKYSKHQSVSSNYTHITVADIGV